MSSHSPISRYCHEISLGRGLSTFLEMSLISSGRIATETDSIGILLSGGLAAETDKGGASLAGMFRLHQIHIVYLHTFCTP